MNNTELGDAGEHEADSPSVPAVQLTGISKRFGAVVACHSVDLALQRGRLHGLLGENGAGKSTLMKMLIGLVLPDSGTISIDGAAQSIRDPRTASALGIGMVHQHFSLVDALTVWENVALGDAGRLDPNATRGRIGEIAEQYGLVIDPDRRVGDLTAGLRQRVEIIKCLRRDPSIVIFDEPTSVLTPEESEQLFESLRHVVVAESRAVVLVSHKLDEVLHATDDITIMRQGRVVDQRRSVDAAAPSLARAMVGREVSLRSERAALGIHSLDDSHLDDTDLDDAGLDSDLTETDTSLDDTGLDSDLTETDTSLNDTGLDSDLTETDTGLDDTGLDSDLTETDTGLDDTGLDSDLTETDTGLDDTGLDSDLTETDTGLDDTGLDSDLTETDTGLDDTSLDGNDLRESSGAAGDTAETGDRDASDTAPAVATTAPPVLRIEAAVAHDADGLVALDEFSLEMHPGEIVGVAGVEGNGQRALGDLLSSLLVLSSGTVTVDGTPVPTGKAGAMARAGIGVIPEDRHDSGLVLDMTVAENLVLVDQSRAATRGLIDQKRLNAFAVEMIEQFNIACTGPNAPMWSVSGGNQQRVVLARELSQEPKILVAANPTRGLDVGAIEYTTHRLEAAAASGVAVLFISSELEEILELSDRIIVMHSGRIAATMARAEANFETLGLCMGGAAT